MIRNVVDAPRDTPRGGGYLEASASETGRNPAGWLPAFQVSPRAAVRVARLDGLPLRGGRAGADGRVRNFGLVEARPGEKVLVLVEHKGKASARILTVQATPS